MTNPKFNHYNPGIIEYVQKRKELEKLVNKYNLSCKIRNDYAIQEDYSNLEKWQAEVDRAYTALIDFIAVDREIDSEILREMWRIDPPKTVQLSFDIEQDEWNNRMSKLLNYGLESSAKDKYINRLQSASTALPLESLQLPLPQTLESKPKNQRPWWRFWE